jgi:hypothetical protein
MKALVIVLTLAVFFVGAVAAAAADDPYIGTWKLNEAKSHFSKGAAKNHTVVYEMSGDMIKVTVDGTDADGNALHNEWTGKFDGKYYAITGSPTGDMRSYRRVNSRTLALREKKGTKVVTTGTITLSRDGKTRTVTTNGTDSKGRRMHNVAVFDKE